MGEVFRAFDERLERQVALKQIRAERAQDSRARRRLLREARLAARLSNPALVPIHDILELEETLWIVMEWVDGEALSRHLERGPLQPAEALPLMIQIAQGLDAMHSEGILHRDIKTENVLVTARGDARIIDFGLAKSKEIKKSLSSSGAILGTPRAMSPEQARGDPLTPSSDLFSLGVLFYEMLGGSPPFRGVGPLETLTQVRLAPHEPLVDRVPDLPTSVSRLVDRLLAKRPEDRPENAQVVLVILEGIVRQFRPTRSGAEWVSPRPRSVADQEPQPRKPEAPKRTGERRQLTVLSCGLVAEFREDIESGSTSDSLDPEHLSEILPRFQRLVHRAAECFDAFLVDLSGHRAVLSTGYPQAQEDAAARAASAALEITTGWRRIRADLEPGRGGDLEVHGGIHTGSAVVLLADGDRHERLVLGRTLDVAIFVRKKAPAGLILLSDTARQVVARHREILLTAFQATSATDEPELFQLNGIAENRPFESTRHRPIRGRDRELGFLEACHRTASEGIGQAALVSAGAGVGKTFLVQALRNRCVEGTPWLEVRCRAYERHRALRPIAALLHQVLDLVVDPSLGTREERIETWVEVLDLPSDVFRPALMSLVGSSVQRCRLEVDAVELQRLETVATEVLFEALERLGRRRAPVLIFEDLQWADGATWTVLDRLIEEAEEMPLLLIATLRPKWSVHRSADLPKTRIHLDPLSKQDALTLAKDILGSAEHDQDRALSVAKRSEGVPLFVEALARAKLGSGEVPPKLMDLLAAQLDRLGSAKQLAHLASVLGRRFTLRELAGFSSFEGIMLDHEFERLVDAEVFARDPAHEGTWTFRSPLLRDAARSSWLDGDRKPPHRGTVI